MNLIINASRKAAQLSVAFFASTQEQPQQPQLPQSTIDLLNKRRERKKNKPSKIVCDTKLASAWLLIRVVMTWCFNGCFWIFEGVEQ